MVLEEADSQCSWGLMHQVSVRDVTLENEKKRIAMIIGLALELSAEVERLRAQNVDLKEGIKELEEENERLYNDLKGWICPNS